MATGAMPFCAERSGERADIFRSDDFARVGAGGAGIAGERHAWLLDHAQRALDEPAAGIAVHVTAVFICRR